MKAAFLIFAIMVSSMTIKAAGDETSRDIESSVSEATVYLEGAQLLRQKWIDVPAGTTIIRFISLSDDIDEKSIQAKVAGNVTVLSVNHQLNYSKLQQLTDQSQSIKNQIDAIDAEVEELDMKLQVLQEELVFLTENRQLAGKDQAISVASLKEADSYYQSRMTTIKSEELAHRRELTKLALKRGNLESQLAGVSTKTAPPTGEIEVKVNAKVACRANFQISYLVKKAGWFPSYDIRANSISEPIDVVYKANVFQNTGEDWQKVKLIFSTGNPQKSGVAPQLQTYLLDYYLRPPVYHQPASGAFEGTVLDESLNPVIGASIIVPGTTIGTISDVNGHFSLTLPANTTQVNVSFIGYKTKAMPVSTNQGTVVLEADVSQLDEVVVVGYGTSSDSDYSPSVYSARPAAPRKAKLESLPVDMTTRQTQTSVLFQIEMPYTVASDNKHMAIDMQHISMDAGFEHYAVPKIEKDAFLLAHITNWEQYNLLGGEANIFFEGTYTGKTIIDPSSFKDTLTLSLGRDKSIVICREKAKDYKSRQMIGSKVVEERNWVISVRNPKAQLVHLTLMDQIPVPYRDEIEVGKVELSGAELDKKTGAVKWQLELNPDESKKLELKYQVKYPKDRNLMIE